MKKIISLTIGLFAISACNKAPKISDPVTETPKVSQAKSCDDYQLDVGENLNRISSLRDKLKKLDCPVDQIETKMSNIAAAKAQKFLKSKNLAAAKNMLIYKYAPKNSWLTQAVQANIIDTIGKGETEPFDIYDASAYSQDEINQIHRRVEFNVDDDVSRNNAC